MDPTLILFIVLLPVFLVVIAICSASETSFFSLTRTDRLRLRRRNPAAGAAVGRLLATPRPLVLTILLITNAGSVAFYVSVSILERRMGHGPIGIAFNLAILFVLILAGDLLPKLIAASNPVAFARILALPLEVAVRVVGPITRFLSTWLVDPSLRLIRSSSRTSQASVTLDELGALLDLSARSGEIEADEQRILAEVIRLGATRVRDVMIPRVAMPWLADRFTPSDVARVLKKSPVDQIPVFRGSPDGSPLGVLDTRTYLPTAEAGAAGSGSHARRLRPVVFIPERARMDQLLDLLRSRRGECALCVDEYGAVVGLITINEVLAELVAGMRSVSTAGEDAGAGPAIERRSSNCWVVPGRLPARELATQLAGAGRPVEGVSTVAGLIFHTLGRVPSEGDSIRMGNVELRVERMSARSVDRVTVTLLGAGEGRAAEGASNE